RCCSTSARSLPARPRFRPSSSRLHEPPVARPCSGRPGVGERPTHCEGLTMSAYQNDIKAIAALKEQYGSSWSAINPESVARMRAQNRFKTGLEIAQYTADIMRKDMAEYDADSSVYTQSLGCWHGFIGQQKLISIKKHLKTTNKRYLYLSGWMVAALRSEFGPLPDQSMHEKTSVPALIEELYTFLRQADARELDLLFTQLDDARAA